MLDPIGGHDRLKDFFIRYLDTAFRIRSPKLSSARRELLQEPGALTTSPYLEPVLRYQSAGYSLEYLLDNWEENPLSQFDKSTRKAFIDIVLSGLFPGVRAENGDLLRKSAFPPYAHQMEMLARGIRNGTPAIVTSGTGSGKTEAFMLPILASIVREATKWPKVPNSYLQSKWWHGSQKFSLKRAGEPIDRRKALRALILYPMNALVEDQMTRLRRTLDAPEVHEAMDHYLSGNRIFFGRYTSASPVTGHRVHPRQFNNVDEQRRLARRMQELRDKLQQMEDDQNAARTFDQSKRKGEEEPTRYLFPSVDSSEMVTRWDMQETPPDILVTNASMLSTMLAREVEAPIFDQTRKWLTEEEDAQFFLVLDELHLIRGSAGTEVSGLIRALIFRLGLAQPGLRHKLRILASSASLPTDADKRDKSIEYLHDFFGSFGTYADASHSGFSAPSDWLSCIVEGKPAIPKRGEIGNLDTAPFCALVDRLSRTDDLITFEGDLSEIQGEIDGCRRVLIPSCALEGDVAKILKEAAEAAGERLLDGCRRDAASVVRATSIAIIAERLFGPDAGQNAKALRGLTVLRGLGDKLKGNIRVSELSPNFRLHQFIRSIEGIFATPRFLNGEVTYDGVTIERGVTYTADAQGYRRKFELVYCEACGEIFIGGMRGRSGGGSAEIELLPSSPDISNLPEAGASGHYEDLSYDTFAVFWPSTRPGLDAGTGEQWSSALLDTKSGVIKQPNAASVGEDVIPGQLFFCGPGQLRSHKRQGSSPGTAAPDCCPACGTNRSQKPRPRYSPIRSFRTGFNKTSQLMATELFELLHVSGSLAKAIVFSDSRQDAARSALSIEQSHYQDLRREVVIEAAKRISSLSGNSEKKAEIERAYTEANSKRNFVLAQKLGAQLIELENTAGKKRVPLSRIVEEDPTSAGPWVSSMLQEMLMLGIHPTDDAGISEIERRPWTSLFEKDRENRYKWKSGGREGAELTRIRSEIVDAQGPFVDEVLFSKSYFALEETGLGYPSLYSDDEKPDDVFDSYLRVFADSYRVSSNKWFLENDEVRDWDCAASVPRGRNKVRLFAAAISRNDPDGELERVLQHLRSIGHDNGIIDWTRLKIKIADKDDPYWRCDNCGRVHLIFGAGTCTRCFRPLISEKTGIVSELWDRNFLANRVVRSAEAGQKAFRLRCEELTGQTANPAERLRRFKGIILENPAGIVPDLNRASLEIDLLSVTTTMEVGIDIGALQTVYQANMPPQRFNYQQRVGRAGRRGQAYSIVLTLCRSRSHDLHYFKKPEAITGDPPPPPFLASEHIEISLRLLRKVWLAAAFANIREDMGAQYPGDFDQDTHGEFVPARLFYDDLATWKTRLTRSLIDTDWVRQEFAHVLGDGKHGRATELLSSVDVDALMSALISLQNSGSSSEEGLAQFLAEQGLLPMYGMPTRVRQLYLGLRKTGPDAVDWDSIDRDLDLAVSEFAPRQVLVRDKRKHMAAGFTQSLVHKPKLQFRDTIEATIPWYLGYNYVGRCLTCDGTSVSENQPFSPVTCLDCGSQIEIEGFKKFYVPSHFRTTFKPLDTRDDFVAPPIKRAVVSEIKEIHPVIVANTNLTVFTGSGAKVMRLNEGQVNPETGETEGYSVTHAHQLVKLPGGVSGRSPRLMNQFVIDEALQDPQSRRFWDMGDEPEESDIRLMSKKATDALYLGVGKVPEGLSLDLFARSLHGSSVRAAAISATHLIVQRAALELDIDPDEFEVLEPRKRLDRPVLQISDMLVNGAGFCRRLGEIRGSEEPLVVGLIRSMLEGGSDPLISDFLGEKHRRECAQSCYRCLQRYGNRQYHGLLDWRLGLGFLRGMIDEKYRSGLDGSWASYPELQDWPQIASQLRDEICRLSPTRRTAVSFGGTGLPGLVETGNGTSRYYVMVHPLWKTNDEARRANPLASIRASLSLDDQLFYIDTFDANRRPVSALDQARDRPAYR